MAFAHWLSLQGGHGRGSGGTEAWVGCLEFLWRLDKVVWSLSGALVGFFLELVYIFFIAKETTVAG